jgi:deferrochelatase/peroxidase EfeB
MIRSDVDPADVQAIAHSGLGSLREAAYLLLRINESAAARRFLHALELTPMSKLKCLGAEKSLSHALQLAFTASGLAALGLEPQALLTFSPEFFEGMAGSPDRSQRLGDIGVNAPAEWEWGYGDREPHVLLMLYARDGDLQDFRNDIESHALCSGLEKVGLLPTSDMHDVEPFGFEDGVSQPTFDWIAPRIPGGKADRKYTNLLALGELLLGYDDEYGYVTDSPYLSSKTAGSESLSIAAKPVDSRDLGRNGSYLVFRQLAQDVRGFWRWVAAEAMRVGVTREMLAETMVGRKMNGAPLDDIQAGRTVPGVPPADVERNGFLFDVDPDGLSCPIGAHVRRANPRTGDLPAMVDGPFDALLTSLGLTTRHDLRPAASTYPWPRNTTIWPKLRKRDDAISSARFHRILRRGREYGGKISIDAALDPATRDPQAGLHFICLNTNLSRQFEFVQGAWLVNSHFAGLSGEQDPLLGNREPFPRPPVVRTPTPTDGFSRPWAPPQLRYSRDMPPFVRVKGGSYFFLPGLAAFRWLTRPI